MYVHSYMDAKIMGQYVDTYIRTYVAISHLRSTVTGKIMTNSSNQSKISRLLFTLPEVCI